MNVTGPGGRSLVEIQQMSGANIQISKKGIFAPGTRNRIVTITGSPTAINAATYLIEQRIQEEEMKRARNNPLVGTLTMQWSPCFLFQIHIHFHHYHRYMQQRLLLMLMLFFVSAYYFTCVYIMFYCCFFFLYMAVVLQVTEREKICNFYTVQCEIF